MPSDYEAITKYNIKSLGDDLSSRKSQVSMYSDFTHFIFEILQNADDYGATEISFDLTSDRLAIIHNGYPFLEENVKAISYFGNSTSREDLIKTGRFGLGFKSVFAFTATPAIHSGDEHFEIFDLYKLRAIKRPERFKKDQTIILLPFDHLVKKNEIDKIGDKKLDFIEKPISPDIAYQRISKRLEKLDIETLLFTINIQEIKWNTNDQGGHYLRQDKHLRSNKVRSTTITDGTLLSKYLIFIRQIVPPKEQFAELEKCRPVNLAFKLNDNNSIQYTKRPLTVLFATKEETHVGFIINGLFRTPPHRETVNYDDPFNQFLVNEISQLLLESLDYLKKHNLLTVEVLKALPIKKNNFLDPEKNKKHLLFPIFEAVKNALIEKYLLPTHSGSFTNAKCAKLARGATLRELINSNSNQLQELFLSENCLFWLTGEITQDKTTALRSYLINELDIEEITPESFARKVTKEFFEKQTNSWIIEFYAYLNSPNGPKNLWEYASSTLRDKEIIRLNDGTHIKPFKNDDEPNAFFPPTDNPEYPEVKHEIMQDERAVEFFKKLGLKEIGEKEAIQSILNSFYINGKSVSSEDNIQHIKKFVKYWKTHDDISIFLKVPFLFDCNKEHLCSYDKFYLDAPFLETGLRHLFEITKNEEIFPLWEEYNNIEGFLDFAIALGVVEKLLIKEVDVEKNPLFYRSMYKSNAIERPETYVREDYTIPDLEKYLSAKDVHISRLIWNTTMALDPKFLKARYRPNRQYTTESSPSQLVHSLKETKWIPTIKGDFLKPSQATKEDLLDNFIYDNGNGWLTAIGFGEDTHEKIELKHVANSLGINVKVLELLQKPEIQSDPNFLSYIQSYIPEKKSKPAFPVRNSANPKRREERLKDNIDNSPDKEYGSREHSVRTSKPNADPRIWLKNQYTNDDEQLICQICQDEMPFKKRDGEYYFEAVEIFDKNSFDKEHEEYYLALCPICVAKYKVFIKNDKDALVKLKESIISSESPEIDINLDEKASIKFVEKHFQDLKTIFKSVKITEGINNE